MQGLKIPTDFFSPLESRPAVEEVDSFGDEEEAEAINDPASSEEESAHNQLE